MFRHQITLLFLLIGVFAFAQRGKDGDLTVSTLDNIVNTYTPLTANANANATNISVDDNSMSGAAFSGGLQPGDLILIYQVQGAAVDVATFPVDLWNSEYTAQAEFFNTNTYNYIEFGAVTDIKEVGKYEFAEVLSINGSNTITLTCGLQNNYTTGANNHTQVIRVPRYENLTVPNNTSITTPAWDGTSGGVVAIEVEEDLTINGTERISADETGFRGGEASPNDNNSADVPGSILDIDTRGFLGSFNPKEGSGKGESVYGGFLDYDVIYSRYCYGAIANGGGGANYHNAGGGGGSNVGTGSYSGYGIVDRGPGNAYDDAWILEDPTMVTNTTSSGGGRGGYSHAEINKNPLNVGPHNTVWGSDFRRISGGVGGHPLTYDQTRAFMGGGGGGGHQNDGFGGDGGAGGGVVFLNVYGDIIGNGTISANGEDGEDAKGTPANPLKKAGDDGAGGAGGGGAILIKNINALPASIYLEAIGGNGGNQVLSFGAFNNNNQADGPGGGGGGGMIAFNTGTPVQNVAGGAAGETNSTFMTNFPVNGATGGAVGMDNQNTVAYDILVENDTICSGETSTLNTTSVGNLSPYPTLSWYENYSGGTALATGNSFTTPVLTATTIYYVGTCENAFRVPVTVVVSPPILLTGTPPVIAHETCNGNDGSITGLNATGGLGNLTFEWNGVVSPSEDLAGAVGDNYILTVEDEVGCEISSDPFTINPSSGPVIDITGISITDESCVGNDGTIAGITASGGTGTLTYAWSPSGETTLDLSGRTHGDYTLTVTDGSGCTAVSGPHTINQNGGAVVDVSNITISNASCGSTDGSITGIIATGTGLTYNWSPSGETTLDVNNLGAGNHSLVITDGAGCITNAGPFSITAPSSAVIDETGVNISDETCDGNDGEITGISVTGGAAPFVYEWNGVVATSEDLFNAIGGIYTLKVTDANGCEVTSNPFTIGASPGPAIDVSGIVISDELCNGTDGSISGITASGGTGTLTYEWFPNGETTLDISGLTTDSYSLTVIDDNGCSSNSGPHTVNEVGGPAVDDANVTIVNAFCSLDNGSIAGITTTGTGHSYAWSPSGGTTLDVSNVGAGLHYLTVSDGSGCSTTTGPYLVKDDVGPELDASLMVLHDEICDGNNGGITGITFTNGNPPFTFDWNGAPTPDTDLIGVVAGTYTLTITDAKGCTDSRGAYTIGSFLNPIVDVSGAVIADETCVGNDGSITGITISGGSEPMTYMWNGYNYPTVDLTGAYGNTYSLEVIDSTGCVVNEGPFVVNPSNHIFLDDSGVSIKEESCNVVNGRITGINVSGGQGALTYLWSPSGATTLDLTNAESGSHTLTITDGSGCSVTSGPHVINKAASPVVDESNVIVTDATCGLNNGSITGMKTVGVGLTYTWLPSGVTMLDINNFSPGTYTFVVSNAAGCQTLAGPYTINTTSKPVLDMSNAVITNAGCKGNDGSITGISSSGGEAPFIYNWNGNSFSSSNLTGLSAVSYTLTITGSNGCSDSVGPITITDLQAPTVDVSTPNQFISPGDSVSINSTFTPPGSTISWSPNENIDCLNCPNPVVTPNESTTYVVTVTSPDGCVSKDSVFIKIDNPCGEIKLPTVFSPNGDGLNDVFCVLGDCIHSIRFQVFNRWGEKIFETEDSDICWDGTFKGEPVNTGMYIYKLIGVKKDGSTIEKTGNVNLVR